MSKRTRPTEIISAPSAEAPSPKKSRKTISDFTPNKIAKAANAAAVDADPPLAKLYKAVSDGVKNPKDGECIAYWMRMGDLRIKDNRALSRASQQAKKDGLPLVVFYILSPQDYVFHDRSPRRIDFVLRNLSVVRESLASLHIPLQTTMHTPRLTVPSHLISLLHSVNAKHLFANIEYEVDELRRDIKVCALSKERGIRTDFFHDRCIVEPGVVTTKEQRVYTVYSPYQKSWLTILNGNLAHYLEDHPPPSPNSDTVRTSNKIAPLFNIQVPGKVEGFELKPDDAKVMNEVFPAGEDVASQILDRFLKTKPRSSQMGAVSPLKQGAEENSKHSRIVNYNDGRDKSDKDTTSRLSPYLSAGVISVRECVRRTMALLNIQKVEASKTTGVGTWVQELAWRDFYTNILVAFPRVSMGRPFNEKMAGIKWEADEGPLQAWKEGRTGYPIVDAAMRCMNQMGWMHNRLRMIVAMFLTKHLMVDWRLGEKFFMEKLIDGDLASNNGGWQWSASTGTDACPYFRIFNPYSQSLKADPTGEFIRHYVPELAKLRGGELHNPSVAVAKKLGYPLPIVKHEDARQRALRRYKNPGEE